MTMTKTQKAALSFFYIEYPEDKSFSETIEMSLDHLTDGHFTKNLYVESLSRSDIANLIIDLYAHLILELGVRN